MLEHRVGRNHYLVREYERFQMNPFVVLGLVRLNTRIGSFYFGTFNGTLHNGFEQDRESAQNMIDLIQNADEFWLVM